MSVGIANNSRVGLCPHGLSPGACPICSGGGGGMRMDRNTRRYAGELTWNECYAIGQMMKAAQARKELAELQQNNLMMQNIQIQNAAIKFAQAFNTIVNFLANKSVFVMARNFIFHTNNTFSKIANFVTNTINNFINNFKNFIVDISDKLAAIFGEEKLAKFKNLGQFIEKSKKKILSLLGFVDESKEENECENDY